MNIIKPSVEIITEPNLFKRIELAARTCYKSEGKIAEGSDVKLYKRLVASGHESTLEHSNIVVECGVHASMHLDHNIGDAERLTGIPSYIRRGPDCFTFSGNLRAWRNLAKNSPRSIVLPYLFKGCMGFDDIPFADVLEDAPSIFGNPRIYVNPEPGTLHDRHTAVTARFVCDRGVSHELVRHRVLAISQESTRYVNYQTGITIVEPWWYSSDCNDADLLEGCAVDSEFHYQNIMQRAANPSPQKARAALLTGVKTEVVATGTVEMWKNYVLPLRLSEAAHPDIRRIMTMFAEMMNWKECLK